MLAGVSTACFYPERTEKALTILAGQGISATEVFLNSDCELDPAYLRNLRHIADAARMRILAVHPYTSGMEPMLFFSEYARRFEDGRVYYRKYYQAANILGAKLVVFHGNSRYRQMEEHAYFERYHRLMQDASASGVMLCHENVSRCAGYLPAFFQQMSAALPDARYVLDVKQALRAEQDIFSFARAMGSRIAHVHLSDHTPASDCLCMGKGILDMPRLIAQLKSQGFDGGLIMELYRGDFENTGDLLEGYRKITQYIV